VLQQLLLFNEQWYELHLKSKAATSALFSEKEGAGGYSGAIVPLQLF